MEKIKQLQNVLREAWQLAYELQNESENVQNKLIFTNMSGTINGLEARIHEILDQDTK
ncbi:MAG: hypothetical protein JWM44_2081 [Bacilli bacterium]|nr:hypothetical protein [Bacilli bacterium]